MRKIYQSLVKASFNGLDVTTKMMILNRRGIIKVKHQSEKKEARLFQLYDFYVLVIYDMPEFIAREVKSIGKREIKKRFPEFHIP